MDLLKENGSVPRFALPDAHSGQRIAYQSLLRKRRIIIVALGSGEKNAAHTWLANALQHPRDFAERDLTVLAIRADKEKSEKQPEGFHILSDADGEWTKRFGGAPAFYLIGKDTGIKWARRDFPTLPALFRLIDSMPMRAEEMRRGK